jgi:peptide/nickel transport system ATP-binding protein
MLDVSIRMGVLNLIGRLARERGVAFLYITHDLASARYVADRTLVMYGGRLVEGGPSEAMMQAPVHPYSRLLLASIPDPDRAGEVAAAAAPPTVAIPDEGCPFAPRCAEATAACRERLPVAVALEQGRWARCHLLQANGAGAVTTEEHQSR